MRKVLFVNACPRPHSRTRLLAQKVLERLEGEGSEVDLFQEKMQPLDWELLRQRDQLISSRNFSAPIFQYANDFAAADDIVIAAPYWDLAFPSVLRIYLEYVTVTGVTFRYSPQGVPEGLCKAERIFYVTTAGGPVGGNNLGYDYVKALAGTFYGVPKVLCFKAENLDIKGADVEGILKNAADEIDHAVL